MKMNHLETLSARQRHLIEVANGDEPADLVLKHATYVNVFGSELGVGDIAISGGRIAGIGQYVGKKEIDVSGQIVIPGFIDAHIHLESSLVTPYQFAKAVIPHGTTSVITDPHEIANVMGTDGIDYMLQATKGLPLDVHFVIPSCVPATRFDENYANIDAKAIEPYYRNPRVVGLAEMMDFVGVIAGQESIIEKIASAKAHHKLVDGHAPGLSGKGLDAYIAAGIYSDHECDTYENALEKARKGQFIMIREGTAAHNLAALLPLLNGPYAERCLFATDDKHPNDLLTRGHIDYIVREAIQGGIDPLVAIKTASYNAARYFHLDDKGAIAPGYLADLLVVDSVTEIYPKTVIKSGKVVYEKKELVDFPIPKVDKVLLRKASDSVHIGLVHPEEFHAFFPLGTIGMTKGQIVTKFLGKNSGIDFEKDLLKIAVLERHHATGHIGIGYIKGYGLKTGAVATSIAHDAHNIIVVGTSDEDMAVAANAIREAKGGIVVVNKGQVVESLPLTIAGLMSEHPLSETNAQLEKCKAAAFALGVSHDVDPFMTLSFMSLSVIPEARIMTKGVFDVLNQRYL